MENCNHVSVSASLIGLDNLVTKVTVLNVNIRINAHFDLTYLNANLSLTVRHLSVFFLIVF